MVAILSVGSIPQRSNDSGYLIQTLGTLDKRGRLRQHFFSVHALLPVLADEWRLVARDIPWHSCGIVPSETLVANMSISPDGYSSSKVRPIRKPKPGSFEPEVYPVSA